jgi:RNA polymerase sigma-70 factor (ECF subfamily)
MPDDSTATTHDAPSLSTLFLAEESRLLHFATKLTGNFATAQDIVQDAFLRLHRQQHSTAAPVALPRAWLFTTIRHLALNHHRKHARLVALAPDDDSRSDGTDAAYARPDAALEHDEALLLLRLCLDELSPADRRLVKLKFEDDLSYDAIARQTKLTRTNVGYRLHTIVKKVTTLFHRAANGQPQ